MQPFHVSALCEKIRLMLMFGNFRRPCTVCGIIMGTCCSFDQVRGAMEKYPPYQAIFSKLSFGESQMLDKAFYEEEVKRLILSFEQQVCSCCPGFAFCYSLAYYKSLVDIVHQIYVELCYCFSFCGNYFGYL